MYRRGGSKTDHNKATKQSDSSKYAELLVFGYACKMFRDNERAIYHDQGKHLIPWMGDKNIMIDRSVKQTYWESLLNQLNVFQRDIGCICCFAAQEELMALCDVYMAKRE